MAWLQPSVRVLGQAAVLQAAVVLSILFPLLPLRSSASSPFSHQKKKWSVAGVRAVEVRLERDMHHFYPHPTGQKSDQTMAPINTKQIGKYQTAACPERIGNRVGDLLAVCHRE